MSQIQSLLILQQDVISNGFGLKKNFEIKFPITVITGKNGSGKTRLLARMQNSGVVYGTDFRKPNIRLFNRENLIPKIGGDFSEERHLSTQKQYIREYEKWKEEGFHPDVHHAMTETIPRPELVQVVNDIAKRLDKDVKELTHEEIEDHAPSITRDPFAHFQLGESFNRWIYDFQMNRKNQGLAAIGEPAKFFSGEEFELHFGPPPWIILNEVIQSVFEGKFEFSQPDIKNRLYNYHPYLLENGKKIDANAISSGEQTILWLALILFQARTIKSNTPEELSVFLFDEPDAFLHPQMVSRMYTAFETICKRFNLAIVLTTHSPTTVALAPEGSLFNISNGSLNPIEVDEAISDLLAGVPQIAIDPQKRRQVHVESHFDARIYQQIFTELKSKLIPSIFLNFIAAGTKIPDHAIKDVIRKHAKEIKEEVLEQIAGEINGQGDSSKVFGQVASLIASGSKTARGIVDWDNKNKPGSAKYVSVLGHQLFYSIENWAIEPLGCIFLLNQINPDKYPLSRKTPDLKASKWLDCGDLLQASLDDFILDVYGHPNRKTEEIKYVNGMSMMSDLDQTASHGHDTVENLVCARFGELKGLAQAHQSKKLTCAIVDKFMVHRTEGGMVPDVVLQCFRELQLDG